MVNLKNGKNLEKFLEENSLDGGFLQSNLWADFNEKLGKKVITEKDRYWQALAVFHELPIVGGYFMMPRGPVLAEKIENDSKVKLLDFIRTLCGKASWVRIEPQSLADLELIEKLIGKECKLVKSKKNHQPEQTLMLDLNLSEKRILADMKPKTRYNIRLAKKRGVKIQNMGKENLGEFLRLNEETAKRDGITTHSRKYYREMVEGIDGKQIELYLAYYEEKVISAAIFSFYGGVATYLHGASSSQYRDVMAPYALQWKAIQDAKKRGFKKYDFGGLRLKELEGGPWQGITRFKTGFLKNAKKGEGIVVFPGAYDIIQSSIKYSLYKFLQWISDHKVQLLKKFKKISIRK